MKIVKIFILIFFSGLVLSGCSLDSNSDSKIGDSVYKLEDGQLCISRNGGIGFECILLNNQELQDQRWEILKDYLGVVEWNEEFEKTGCGLINKNILTDDKNKVEYVKLGCGGVNLAECCKTQCPSDARPCPVITDMEFYNRCQTLKELIK
jgi:hypothetical protein